MAGGRGDGGRERSGEGRRADAGEADERAAQRGGDGSEHQGRKKKNEKTDSNPLQATGGTREKE